MAAHQASMSLGFSRQEHWSGLPFPSSGDLPHPGIKPGSLKSPVLGSRFFTTSATWEALLYIYIYMLLLLLSHFSRVRLCATHRWQPTRLPHPWDSPGKNNGVRCLLPSQNSFLVLLQKFLSLPKDNMLC